MHPFNPPLGGNGNGADRGTIVTQEVIDTILEAPEKSASDLVALYLSVMLSDAATMDYDVEDVGDRIIEALNRMADDGDEEALMAALMAALALVNLLTEDAPPAARAVFIVMLEVVILKPIALAAAHEQLDYHTAGLGVAAIKSFTESLLREGLDDDDDDDGDGDDEIGAEELDSILDDLENGGPWPFGRN